MLKSCSRGFTQSRWILKGLPLRSRSLPPVRLCSTYGQSQGGGGAAKLVVGGLVTVTGLVGGTIGYAGYDNEFRSYVEDMVPGAREAFVAILGEAEQKKKPSSVVAAPPSKLKTPPVKVTSTPSAPKMDEKKPEPIQEKPIEPEVQQIEAAPPEPSPPPPPLLAPPPFIEEPVLAPEPSPEVVEEAVPVAKPGEAENVALDLSLEEACRVMENMAETAVVAGITGTEAMRTHMHLVQRVLETNASGERDDKNWNQVFEAATRKSESLSKAEASMTEAKAAVKIVLETIEKGKKNELTNENPSLIMADEKVNEVLIRLEQTRIAMEATRKEALAVERYRDLIDEGRQQFQKEIAAILPHVNLSTKEGSANLTEDELNLFLTHAYQKVCHLQQELAKWKILEQERADQQARSAVDTEELIQSELNSQRRELELEYHRRITALRNEMENEMRSQLRRQAAAHSDHITDVLEVQKKELDRINARQIDETVTSERAAHKQELAKIFGKIEAVEKNIEARANMDDATRDAQALWLATVALSLAVQRADASSVKLKEAIDKLSSGFSNDQYVQAVLNSLPKEVTSEKGIPSEMVVRDRFFRVEKLARRTALVESEGGSLLRYALSYLQSLFILSPPTDTMPDKSIPIDVDSLNTFDIVWLARGALERGDLEQAVKYMTLLKGMPRNVSRDWLDDARLVLETQLACRALLVHAAALGGEVFTAK